MSNKKKVNITIDADVEQAVREAAKQDNRKFSNMVDTILKEWIDKRKNN